jgi:hypothetical protein
MRVKFLYFLIPVILLIIYFFPVNTSKGKMKIKCRNMAYACGDCYPQYRVLEILQNQNEESKKILNKELKIEFESEKIEKDLDVNTSRCLICYDFYFTGVLKKSFHKGAYFIVETVNYKLKNDSCCK